VFVIQLRLDLVFALSDFKLIFKNLLLAGALFANLFRVLFQICIQHIFPYRGRTLHMLPKGGNGQLNFSLHQSVKESTVEEPLVSGTCSNQTVKSNIATSLKYKTL
jgi:hypothetical protein